VTSQLIRALHELRRRHRQIHRQIFSDRMIVSMCSLWGSLSFSELFLMPLLLTVFKNAYTSPLEYLNNQGGVLILISDLTR